MSMTNFNAFSKDVESILKMAKSGKGFYAALEHEGAELYEVVLKCGKCTYDFTIELKKFSDRHFEPNAAKPVIECSHCEDDLSLIHI